MFTHNSYILSDIFLEVLERNGNYLSREFVRRVRLYIKSPDFAKLFNFIVVNSLGGKIHIKRSTIDNAVDFLIKTYEKEIENDKRMSDKEKAKQQMKTDMYMYRDMLKGHVASSCLLE